MSPPRTRLVLFDLDGTLIDTVPDLAFCADETLAQLGLPRRGEQAVRLWVGGGIELLLRRALAGEMEGQPPPGLLRRALPIFVEAYDRNTSRLSRIYPGVRETLARLRNAGIERACVTNKAERFTEKLLREMELREEFGVVVCGDTLPRRKPDPLPLLHAAGQLGCAAPECLVVGDSVTDVSAARAAGMRIVCVRYGYNHGREIAECAPDAVVDSLLELPGLPG